MKIQSKILGFINLLLGLFFIYVAFLYAQGASFNINISSPNEIKSVAYYPIWVGFPALISALNLLFSFQLLLKNPKNEKLFLWSLFIVQVCFWLLSPFFGWFFASTPLMPITILIIQAGLAYLAKNIANKKLILCFFLVTFLVIFLTFKEGFEEDYCERKGRLADPNGTKSISIGKEDAEYIKKTYGVGSGPGKYQLQWITHALCHKDFKFWPALKETWKL